MTLNQLATTIRQHRKQQRLTQAEVAERAGVDQATVARAERGRVSWDTLLAIGEALGLTLTWTLRSDGAADE